MLLQNGTCETCADQTRQAYYHVMYQMLTTGSEKDWIWAIVLLAFFNRVTFSLICTRLASPFPFIPRNKKYGADRVLQIMGFNFFFFAVTIGQVLCPSTQSEGGRGKKREILNLCFS